MDGDPLQDIRQACAANVSFIEERLRHQPGPPGRRLRISHSPSGIRRSKTDPEGQGRRIGIPYGSTPTTCPVRALDRWLEILGADEGPVFRKVNRHEQISGKRLTAQSVALVVKRPPPRLASRPSVRQPPAKWVIIFYEDSMKRSTHRILTTHGGALRRPSDLAQLVSAKDRGEQVDGTALLSRIRAATEEAVKDQLKCGLDVVNDGEFPKISWMGYYHARLKGIEKKPLGVHPLATAFRTRPS